MSVSSPNKSVAPMRKLQADQRFFCYCIVLVWFGCIIIFLPEKLQSWRVWEPFFSTRAIRALEQLVFSDAAQL